MNLVFAVDGSDAAKRALEVTQKFAKDANAKVHIVTSLFGGRTSDADSIEKANLRLESAKLALEKEGIICETHLLVRGLEPAEDIIDYAGEIHADFIIIGIVKTSRVEKAIMGSTAQQVILEAPCPVISVR